MSADDGEDYRRNGMNSFSFEALMKDVRSKTRSYNGAKSELWTLISFLKKHETLSIPDRRRLLAEAYSPLSVKDIRPRFAMDLEQYKIGVSFRSSLAHTRLWKKSLKKQGAFIAPGGNSKSDDRKFAKQLGVPVPEVFAENEHAEEIMLRPRTVLKPEHGSASNGVFYIDEDLSLFSFSSFCKYETVTEALSEVKSKKLRNSPVWKLEQAITSSDGELAHDFKVWAFYGRLGVVQEIKRNPVKNGVNEYFYHRPTGGEFRMNGARKRLDTEGFPADILDYAQKISRASPVPFLRIDFLAADENVFLGEITPHPGGTYAGQLFDEADKELGEMFYEAEARLYLDLLKGKKFPEFFGCYDCGLDLGNREEKFD